MTRAILYYGFVIGDSEIEELYPRDKYPDMYEDENDGDKAIDYAHDKIKKKLTPGMKIFQTDFEYNTRLINCEFVEKYGSESVIILGTEVVVSKAHSNGYVTIPEITEKHKDILENFVDENPKFKYLEPGLQFVYGEI